ncbi:unnamed protein product [Acanthoscelides obtectus]|uniref:Uncharacterized protein n=1 Tax=Acanthoscelides obtectus TaxID=200917 RepID=A0A9P0KT96_ACAOB|nr:unnamed protein product [Acanthoscelides obtectus]CAK1631932.1 Phospholipid phosphatase 5 [Acanthoscelides obtectus]
MITINIWVDYFFAVLLRVGLWALFLELNNLPPVIRHIDEEELWYYRYPSLDSYVPTLYLYFIMILVPAFILFMHYLCSYREERTMADIINCVNGLTLAYCLNGLFSSTMKLTIGRPRYNWRCFAGIYHFCYGITHIRQNGQ